jgi:hypothetical protein
MKTKWQLHGLLDNQTLVSGQMRGLEYRETSGKIPYYFETFWNIHNF